MANKKTKAKKAASKKAGSRRSSASSLPNSLEISDTEAVAANADSTSPKKCIHLKGAIRVTRLQKQLPSTLKKGPCCTVGVPSACRKDKDRAKSKGKKKRDDTSGSEDGGGSESPLPPRGEPSSLWLCCKCGDLNCGRADESHALKHFESDSSHAVAVNIQTLECWCYACDEEVVSSTNHNQLAAEAKAMLQDVLKSVLKDIPAKAVPLVTKAKSKSVTSPGLTNLGNTCFFNSVMQCIAYTAPLWDVKPKLSPSTSTRRPVTESLLGFLDSMRDQRKSGGGTVNPKILFGALSNEWRMYKRMGQQDSHELLRRLLDGVREEQLDRSPGRKPGHQITPVDEVFGGQLCQIIVCDTCQHISYAFEDYLDLSLPIKDEAKDSWGLSSLFSRRKSSTRSPRSSPIPDSSSVNDDEVDYKSEYAKDPENMKLVKTLLEPIGGVVPESNPTLQQCLAKFFAVETLQGDSVYSCDTCFKLKYGITPAEHRKELEQFKIANTSETANTDSDRSERGSDVEDAEDGGVSLSDGPSAPEDSPERSVVPEVRIDRSNILDDGGDDYGERGDVAGSIESVTPSEEGGTVLTTLFETVRSRTSSVASSRVDPLMPVAEDGHAEEDVIVVPPTVAEVEKAGSDDENGEVFYTPDGQSLPPSSLAMLSPSPTTTTTTSKAITSRAPRPPERPPVQSRAFKRYLIHTAPEVLVVHLKRFQQVGFGGRTKKLEDVVAFEKEMDLGVFLAPADVEKVVHDGRDADAAHPSPAPVPSPSPTPKPPRRAGKYRLYGVVVHGGGLFSGHYVAYCRINGTALPPPDTATTATTTTTANGSASLLPPPPPSADDEGDEWAYCSDSHVRPSSWEEVSKAQAYLLMYERIPDA
ncbi:Ubiquitin carboxyl-terminal hydrolase 45 [Geranomyces michiganensis]|nr:Ubiquitin carboxyl-terminal hydrolase 45 [Geranomyces michiganensis]